MIRLIIVVALLAGSVSAHGYGLYGAGSESCATWTSRRSTNDPLWGGSISWVFGWVSAAGYWEVAETNDLNDSGDLAHTDHNAIAVWIDKYCSQNLVDDLEDATIVLVEELARRAG